MPGSQDLGLQQQQLINDGKQLQLMAKQLAERLAGEDNKKRIEQTKKDMSRLAQQLGDTSQQLAESMQFGNKNASRASQIPLIY